MELNRHSFLELKYVVFSLGSMEKKSVFIFPQSLLAKLVAFFGSILLFHLAFNKVDKNCIIFRYIMSLPSYQENLRILEIFIHCWQATDLVLETEDSWGLVQYQALAKPNAFKVWKSQSQKCFSDPASRRQDCRELRY